MSDKEEIQEQTNSEDNISNISETSQSHAIVESNYIDIINANNNPDDNLLPWPDYFMSLCILTAARSKDPHTKVGACIVNENNEIISIGYNGMPRGIPDEYLTWEKSSPNYSDTKYAYVCHAEMNAIMNHKFSLEKCTLYVTLHPCNECAKMIIQSGIKEVIYGANTQPNSQQFIAAEKMFRLAKINCRKFQSQVHQILICSDEGEIFIS